MDEFMKAYEQYAGRQPHTRPTIQDVVVALKGLEQDGKVRIVGLAHPEVACCASGHAADAIAVVIPTEETEVRIRKGEFAPDRSAPNPEFDTILLPIFDLHSGENMTAVLDVEACKELVNIIGTAIRLKDERRDRVVAAASTT